MFENYKDIFNQRGHKYHQAMLQYPHARIEEFKQIIHLADLQDHQIIADIPSGGCYLGNFIEQDLKIISVETSQEFIKDAQTVNNNTIVVCDNINQISLVSDSLDRVLSLAGLHHVDHRLSFYQEVYRLLKPEGIFVIADALENSPVAKFLNIFVHQHNSLGHCGNFLNLATQQELETAKFKVVYAEPIGYDWRFDSLTDMVNYCQLLFGIDRATPQQVQAGIEQYLGYDLKDNQYCLHWELYFLKSLKI
jgi:SAM-dependent methyltransferase